MTYLAKIKGNIPGKLTTERCGDSLLLWRKRLQLLSAQEDRLVSVANGAKVEIEKIYARKRECREAIEGLEEGGGNEAL